MAKFSLSGHNAAKLTSATNSFIVNSRAVSLETTRKIIKILAAEVNSKTAMTCMSVWFGHHSVALWPLSKNPAYRSEWNIYILFLL